GRSQLLSRASRSASKHGTMSEPPPGRRAFAHPPSAVFAAALWLGAVFCFPSSSLSADGAWWPFGDKDAAATRRPRSDPPRPFLSPMDGQPDDRRGRMPPGDEPRGYPAPDGSRNPYDAGLPPVDSRSRAVERSELAPVMASDGSGLPFEVWQGLDLPSAEKIL